jgi:hypothetical protein
MLSSAISGTVARESGLDAGNGREKPICLRKCPISGLIRHGRSCWLLPCVLFLGSVVCHAATFQVDGQRVRVESARYVAVIEGLAITRIENKLTGEVYAEPPGKAAAPSPALAALLGEQGVALESLRPAIPVKWFQIGPRTRLAVTRGTEGVVMTYTGLEYGRGENAEFDGGLTVRLRISVDPATEDLVVAPEVKGNIEMVRGVRDRGVLRNSLHLLNLADNLKLIVPTNDGKVYAAADAAEWEKSPARWSWPMFWEAALLIAESDKGCLGVWADEAPLEYGRHLSVARSGGRWHVGVEFETSDMIYRCDEIKNASWRLNVFQGYWVKAAERYRRQMVRQWKMKPLAEQSPAWADKVRIVISPDPGGVAALARLVPKDTMVAFTTQGWLRGWNTGEMHKKGENYHPNWPLDNPVRWEGVEGFEKTAKQLEDLHVHVFPYTNAVIIETEKHPWIGSKIGDRHFWAWRIWQRFYPELCLDIVRRYGVSGIYEDCSWVHGRHLWGEPDGDNWYNGSVRMREYFHELMPQVALMGERNNEITARGQQFALGWVGSDANAHPICAYLFEPFIQMFNLNSEAQAFDAEDIRGFTVTNWFERRLDGALQEDLMVRKRGIVFANEQLKSYWPQTWDPRVLHYFRGKDGTEYRFVRDQGTRFVRLAGGGEQTIYWRVKGVAAVTAPGNGIDGWVGYDGQRIVGLNPARLYVVVEGVPQPPVTISGLPDGYAIDRTVVRDGYWVACLDALGRLKTVPAPDAPEETPQASRQVVRVRAARSVKFLGVEQAVDKGGGQYELTVNLPGSFAAVWAERPRDVAGAASTYLGELPAKVTLQRISSGVLCQRESSFAEKGRGGIRHDPGAGLGAEASVTWLLALPKTPLRCAFAYGAAHGYGDGANYMVRVNGRTLWKRYFNETADDPKDAAVHKGRPPITDAVDLSAFAGQTIVLELATNGHYSAGSDIMRWAEPRLEPRR